MRKNKSKPNSKTRTSSKRRDSWEDRESRDMKRDNSRKREESKDGTNDPRWYATDPALLRDSASLAFSWPIGQPLTINFEGLENTSTAITGLSSTHENIPGLCACKIVPTMGAGLDSDALNVAADAVYTYVRHTNAGHANYDPVDLMIYIVAMTQVYSYINYLQRIYALATAYDQRNRFLPKGIMRAMNIDADSIIHNLADFRYAINVLINKVSSIAVPATMSLFLRQAMLYSYVYAESETVKDQLYFYYPDGFYQFSLDNDQAGMLKYVKMTDSLGNDRFTWDELITYGNNLFTAIWDQEDFGIMSGDILKSYGDNILKLSSLEEVLPFAPVYDKMVLQQIKNATITPTSGLTSSSLNIVQDPDKHRLVNEIQYNVNADNIFVIHRALVSVGADKILTIDSPDPTPEEVIESTRLMTGAKHYNFDGTNYQLELITGSEMVSEVTVWTRPMGPGADGEFHGVSVVPESLDRDNPGHLRQVITRQHLSKYFKYFPTVTTLLVDTATTPNRVAEIYYTCEVDNFAVISRHDLEKQHTAAFLNMLNVPSAAKNVRV